MFEPGGVSTETLSSELSESGMNPPPSFAQPGSGSIRPTTMAPMNTPTARVPLAIPPKRCLREVERHQPDDQQHAGNQRERGEQAFCWNQDACQEHADRDRDHVSAMIQRP